MELTPPNPLARWDGLHLAIDLTHLEALLNERTAGVPNLRKIRLTGVGDAVEATVGVQWKGVRSSLSVRIGEIRLRHRRIGFRLGRIRALGGVPLPRAGVEAVLAAIDHELVSVIRGTRIVVVDLRTWIPPELDLSVITVQATRNRLHVWFGPGSLLAVPGPAPLGLPAGGPDAAAPATADNPEIPALAP